MWKSGSSFTSTAWMSFFLLTVACLAGNGTGALAQTEGPRAALSVRPRTPQITLVPGAPPKECGILIRGFQGSPAGELSVALPCMGTGALFAKPAISVSPAGTKLDTVVMARAAPTAAGEFYLPLHWKVAADYSSPDITALFVPVQVSEAGGATARAMIEVRVEPTAETPKARAPEIKTMVTADPDHPEAAELARKAMEQKNATEVGTAPAAPPDAAHRTGEDGSTGVLVTPRTALSETYVEIKQGGGFKDVVLTVFGLKYVPEDVVIDSPQFEENGTPGRIFLQGDTAWNRFTHEQMEEDSHAFKLQVMAWKETAEGYYHVDFTISMKPKSETGATETMEIGKQKLTVRVLPKG